MEMPDNWDREDVSPFSERELNSLKIQTTHKMMVKMWHDSLGHLQSGNLSHSLKKMGIPVKYLTTLISNYQCNSCDANMGRRGYLLKKLSFSSPPSVTLDTTVPRPVTDPVTVTPPPTITPGSIPSILDPDESSLEHDMNFWKSWTTPSEIPTLDVRMDYTDTCHINRSGNRYFLLFVDKTEEYVQNYNTKTRSNPTPLTLLKSFITFTGKVPRYLLMDGVKEFHSAKMLDFCRDNKIVIQPVIAYNHTAIRHVESYIGVVKSHASIGMLNVHVP